MARYVTSLIAGSLLASVAMAAADKPGGGSAADEARARAKAAQDAQAKAEKDKADKDAQAAQDRSDGGGASQADAPEDGPAPPVNYEGLDPTIIARLDAQDRLIKSLTAQMAGATGPAPTEAKDPQVAASGAGYDPRIVRPLPPGVSSAPSTQPMPASDGGRNGIASLGSSALWGEGGPRGAVQARAYPTLKEEDVIVAATGYHDDAIRNAGDVIRGYSGPAGSWFVPKRLVDGVGSLEEAARRWKRELSDYAAEAAR